MKILFILEYYHPHVGGVETFFQKLAEGLAGQDFDITIITSQVKGSKKYEELGGVKIKRLSLPTMGQRYWFTFLAPFYLFWQVKKYDLIHTTTYNAALPAWLASFFWRKKIILTVHEVWGKFWFKLPQMNFISGSLHYAFEWLIFKLPFTYYVAVSDYTKNCLLKIGKPVKKLDRVYHGIDYDFFDAEKYNPQEIRDQLKLGDNFVYTYFGRPGWIKGLNYLIQAVPIIKEKIPNSKLLLILSQDPPQPYLAIKKLIQDLNISEDVVLINSVPRPELPKHIVASDCVVVPSLSEGFGFTAAETCALKIPVVTTTAGSLPEVVSGQVSQCPPADSAALAQSIIKIYKKEFTEIPFKEFSWDQAITDYIKLYQKINS